ncbi:hypothetical protein CLAIMM_11122 [Cladophialophora immunda]|nr:hypothetical protein CLAIMM_11122 [Cladophialophora immunda]
MSIIPTGPMAISTGNKELSELQEPDKLRQLSQSGAHPGIRQRLWGLQARLDPTVTFEEYSFWAKIEREMEALEYRRYMARLKGAGMMGYIKAYFSNSTEIDASSIAGSHEEVTQSESTHGHLEKEKEKTAVIANNDTGITPIAPSSTHDLDAEWRRAARALRTTGWITIFYLITTDILGWSQTPYVFASCGYGLGVGIFLSTLHATPC